jgi:integrase
VGVRGLAVQLAAIRAAHERSGFELEEDAALRQTLKGIRRLVGAPPKKKGHFSVDQIREMVRTLPPGLRGLRDRALLLAAYASGGRRRSEVTAMDVEHLQVDGENILWTLPRSKTDQEGRGFEVALFRARDPELCAVRALTAWISAAGVSSGPVFRQVNRWGHVSPDRVLPRTVASVVKEGATRLGLNPRDYGGHSLRASFATNAARAGARLEDIQARTGHRDLETLMEYIRRGRVLERDSTVEAIGG